MSRDIKIVNHQIPMSNKAAMIKYPIGNWNLGIHSSLELGIC